mmetsp:Transcript_45341/g.52139  ORF Transcript_45341/g.52139 Transcript_45341/m.52139 type:complete len:254 (-) Transcript_45341:1324-2085(-)
MLDFFNHLREDNKTESELLSMLKKLKGHPGCCDTYSLEEVYSIVTTVYKDLSLNEKEIALWWTILESFGLNNSFEFITTLYCAGYATKETFASNELIDMNHVHKNFVEGFNEIYPQWRFGKNIYALTSSNKIRGYLRSVPMFLNKNVDYDLLVFGLTGEDHSEKSRERGGLEQPKKMPCGRNSVSSTQDTDVSSSSDLSDCELASEWPGDIERPTTNFQEILDLDMPEEESFDLQQSETPLDFEFSMEADDYF